MPLKSPHSSSTKSKKSPKREKSAQAASNQDSNSPVSPKPLEFPRSDSDCRKLGRSNGLRIKLLSLCWPCNKTHLKRDLRVWIRRSIPRGGANRRRRRLRIHRGKLSLNIMGFMIRLLVGWEINPWNIVLRKLNKLRITWIKCLHKLKILNIIEIIIIRSNLKVNNNLIGQRKMITPFININRCRDRILARMPDRNLVVRLPADQGLVHHNPEGENLLHHQLRLFITKLLKTKEEGVVLEKNLLSISLSRSSNKDSRFNKENRWQLNKRKRIWDRLRSSSRRKAGVRWLLTTHLKGKIEMRKDKNLQRKEIAELSNSITKELWTLWKSKMLIRIKLRQIIWKVFNQRFETKFKTIKEILRILCSIALPLLLEVHQLKFMLNRDLEKNNKNKSIILSLTTINSNNKFKSSIIISNSLIIMTDFMNRWRCRISNLINCRKIRTLPLLSKLLLLLNYIKTSQFNISRLMNNSSQRDYEKKGTLKLLWDKLYNNLSISRLKVKIWHIWRVHNILPNIQIWHNLSSIHLLQFLIISKLRRSEATFSLLMLQK